MAEKFTDTVWCAYLCIFIGVPAVIVLLAALATAMWGPG